MRFENRSDVVNKILLKDISSGEAFTNAHMPKSPMMMSHLREGYRALTLPGDNFQGKSDTMVLGKFIDIYTSSNDNSWVLENIKIMSSRVTVKALMRGSQVGIMMQKQ